MTKINDTTDFSKLIHEKVLGICGLTRLELAQDLTSITETHINLFITLLILKRQTLMTTETVIETRK